MKEIIIDAYRTACSIFVRRQDIETEKLVRVIEDDIINWDYDLGGRQEAKSKTFRTSTHEIDGRTLTITMAHRNEIENALGVDLIYELVEEKKLVFLQYKVFDNGRIYASQTDIEQQINKIMDNICPHTHCAGRCPNSQPGRESQVDISAIRLLGCCPSYLKLCYRETYQPNKGKLVEGKIVPACWAFHYLHHGRTKVLEDSKVNKFLTVDEFESLFIKCLIGSLPQLRGCYTKKPDGTPLFEGPLYNEESKQLTIIAKELKKRQEA